MQCIISIEVLFSEICHLLMTLMHKDLGLNNGRADLNFVFNAGLGWLDNVILITSGV